MRAKGDYLGGPQSGKDHQEVTIPVEVMQRVQETIPDVSNSAAVREILRRYLYLHNEVTSLAEAQHLMDFWHSVDGKKRRKKGEEHAHSGTT